MRLAARDGLAEKCLDYSYRLGAIPVMLALEANADPQGTIVCANLVTLFADKKPGDCAFGRDF